MDLLQKPPQWLVDALPEGAKDIVNGWGWYAILGLAGLILLVLLWVILSKVLGLFGGKSPTGPKEPNLEEDLGTYPPLKPSTGDRQLRVEGVPVRMRLVVIGPAGKESEVDPDEIEGMLEKVLPGLGLIYKADKPRLRVWPMQLSYEGFTTHFHRNMITPEKPGELSPWVLVAGRAKLGKQQIMLAFALQAVKPTTIGHKTIDAHEWVSVLRVRVRD